MTILFRNLGQKETQSSLNRNLTVESTQYQDIIINGGVIWNASSSYVDDRHYMIIQHYVILQHYMLTLLHYMLIL